MCAMIICCVLHRSYMQLDSKYSWRFCCREVMFEHVSVEYGSDIHLLLNIAYCLMSKAASMQVSPLPNLQKIIPSILKSSFSF